MRLRLPGIPPLHDIPQHIPSRVGHWAAARVGMSHAYAFFCHHCPEPDLWDAAPASAADPEGLL